MKNFNMKIICNLHSDEINGHFHISCLESPMVLDMSSIEDGNISIELEAAPTVQETDRIAFIQEVPEYAEEIYTYMLQAEVICFIFVVLVAFSPLNYCMQFCVIVYIFFKHDITFENIPE